ncbi:hypothetical protein ACFW9F_11800 [Streptomyces sp. NPDC059506]|uniref:hypothetical protein n=1 Tax=Streptomyces sp. NPDC059506 TaxID=3347751 RepID=UPI0036A65184
MPATNLSWHLWWGEPALPPMLLEDQRAWSALVLDQAVGVRALEAMRATGAPVGPVRLCTQHRTVHVLVDAAAAESPVTARFALTPGNAQCPASPSYGNRHCHEVWLAPPGPAAGLTDFRDLSHQVFRARAARLAA